MSNKLTLLILFIGFIALSSIAKEVPLGIRSLDQKGDAEAINENFVSLSRDIKRLESRVLRNSASCELDTPLLRGDMCFDITDFKLYVATAVTTKGYMVVGQQ